MASPRLAIRWLAAITFVVAAGCSDPSRAAVDAAIDTPPDTPLKPCPTCGADQICVASYDGTCLGGPICVARTVDCPNNTCSPACEAAYCHLPYQCQERPPCGSEPPGAFTCYGP